MRNDPRLGPQLRKILQRSECAISVASVWEMLLKQSHGKLPLPDTPLGPALEAQGFGVLAITAAHVETTQRFEAILADPFDRLLLATAAEENLLLLTQDTTMLALASRTRLPVAEIDG